MRFSCPIRLLAIAVFLMSGMSVASAQETYAGPKQDGNVGQTEALKAISAPPATYPDEAIRKKIEGKVTVRIIVDAKGNVSEATALSGPPELIPAALAAVNKWKFEPPAHPPVTKSVELGFGFDKQCPGPVSDAGEIMGGTSLRDETGTRVAVVDGDQYPLLPFPDAERKAGVAGKMVLSVSLEPDGRVKEIHVIKSLSPTMDRMAIDAVRPLRFKRVGESTASLQDLRMQFVFQAVCRPTFK